MREYALVVSVGYFSNLRGTCAASWEVDHVNWSRKGPVVPSSDTQRHADPTDVSKQGCMRCSYQQLGDRKTRTLGLNTSKSRVAYGDYQWRRWVGHWYPVGLLNKYFWWYASASHHKPAGSMTVVILSPLGSKCSFWIRAVTSLAISSCSGVWVKIPERYSKAICEYTWLIGVGHG